MKKNQFFAMLSRMKYINRWGLMRNTRQENNCEHSLETAYIAHALGLIANRYFGKHLDAQRLAVLGMYHDVTEIITGDMPTPVKYYSPVIRQAYAGVEQVARDQLLEGLPEEMREDYRPLLMPTEEEKELWKYVKAADSISAYLKCIEERNMGNEDFRDAEQSIREKIQNMHLPEAEFFIEHFLPAYEGTLDESGEQES
ncbi:MAG: 5'-deoxynucleotidase [Lachnospiraceae bacterium]|jgi:5'-deoxynucleotidase|nr:5'-deoxynucleotidase [Lachnospiraceae bacterium]MCH4030382.1 5'-deoxynucleotidase [Lachnospiraceae bacterium]MCH4069594.1 5'-deoxynucleotidase [Lachnospiraceae bacterium]MCH4107470.1 5'-deoxynucleotidase [Lachnospiraceae bacterium]MCI1301679.1 5'-deoxynucleotidase [Lachnospiraceae bacterium]